MTTTRQADAATRLRAALNDAVPSARLQAALAAGTHPQPEYVDVLVQQCALEADFYVRDMLTWSLTRHPQSLTVPLLLAETRSATAQARSQALHTLSKIGDPRGWNAISQALMRDHNDEVARSAWRAAVILVPRGSEAELARALSTQLARGGRDLRLSLSRALAALGDAALPALADAAKHTGDEVRTHALATEYLVHNADAGFDEAVFEAQRIMALANAPMPSTPRSDGTDRTWSAC